MRRYVRIPALLLPLVLLAGCQDDAAKLAEHMDRGKVYAEEGRFREAVIEYKSALQLDPNHADAHYQLAHAYLRSQKPREGFWELRETVRLDSNNHDAALEFSQLAILAGEKEEALKRASAVVDADPKNVRAYLVMGQALGALERFPEALETYRKALTVEPEHETALRVLARALEAREENEEVAQVYQDLIAAHPTYENYSLLARFKARRSQGEPAEIEALLNKALELAEGESRADAYAQLASFYVRSNRIDEGFAVLERGIAEEEQDTVQLIYALARLHSSQGNVERADELVEEATRARPDEPGVHRVLAGYLARKNDLDGALAAVNRAMELDAEDVEGRLQKAELLMELGFRNDREGAVEEARGILDAVLAEEPSNPRALVTDARLRLGQGDVEAAVGMLQEAIDLRPNWGKAHYLLGVALAAKRDYPGSRVELARSLEIDTSMLDAKLVLAQVHARLGEHEYAVERGREYLREKPDQTRIRLLVAQSLVRLDRLDEAERELMAVPEEERDGETLFALGRILQARDDLAGARKFLEAANASEPNQPDILQALFTLDRRQEREGDSEERIAAALEADPENARLHQLAGVIAFAQGSPVDAEEHLRRAVELDPLDLMGYERLARFFARTGRLDETARIYEQALEVRPEEPQLHHFLGVLYELSGDRERAIERYEEAIKYGPEMAEAKNNLAYIYADSDRNLDRALDLAQDAKALLPQSPSVADTLGWVLFKRGVHSAAISYLKEAEAATDAGDASLGMVRFHLAQAYEASGEPQEALAATDRALSALESQRAEAREGGGEVPKEPEWAADARALRERLRGQAAAN